MTKDPSDLPPSRPSVLSYDPTAAIEKQNRRKNALTSVCTFNIFFLIAFGAFLALSQIEGWVLKIVAPFIAVFLPTFTGVCFGLRNKGILFGTIAASSLALLGLTIWYCIGFLCVFFPLLVFSISRNNPLAVTSTYFKTPKNSSIFPLPADNNECRIPTNVKGVVAGPLRH